MGLGQKRLGWEELGQKKIFFHGMGWDWDTNSKKNGMGWDAPIPFTSLVKNAIFFPVTFKHRKLPK